MAQNTIFYFSGTGNSLHAAKLIAQKIGDCDIINIAHTKAGETGLYVLEGKPQRVGFVFPCYAGGLPNIVTKFIKMLDIPGIRTESYCFAVATYGGEAGNALSQVKELLSSQRLELSYGANIKMVSNYIALYKMAENAKEKAENAETEIKIAAQDIAANKRNNIPKAKALIKIFYKSALKAILKNIKFFNVGDSCNACGNCVKLCPSKNIKIENGRAVFGEQCEQCMACIQWCPKEAINFKTKTVGALRYHHPNISYQDMLA
ncbi:MAG: EFR1 family ferrodoxin [Termitinemataceae bacterium]|nr:MAG: EFR1 family ferrodoxin [Termitinemataceae bacterium]